MRVTPVRCIAKIFSVFAAAFSLAVISCAANDDSASLTIQMPGSSSSRAISSEGHLADTGWPALNYSVYIRDDDNKEIEKYTNVAPGTKLTISALRAGNYKVAIRGINSGIVRLYGAADAFVQGGVENTVNIKLEEDNNDGLLVLPPDNLQMGGTITGRIKCENGDSYSVNTSNIQWFGTVTDSPTGYQCYSVFESYFFEPGFTYKIEISVDRDDDSFHYQSSTSATATKDGIVFMCN